MADDPDALWKPGNDGEVAFERPSPAPFGSREARSSEPRSADVRPPDPGPPTRPGTRLGGTRRGRIGTAVGVVALVTVVAAVVTTRPAVELAGSVAQPERLPVPAESIIDAERTERIADVGDDVILAAGDVPLSIRPTTCRRERLPVSVDERWSTSQGGVRGVLGTPRVGDEVVVTTVLVTPGADAAQPIGLLAHSIDTGSIAWADLSPTVDDLDVIGIVSGNVVTVRTDTDGRTLTARSEATGEIGWQRPLTDGEDVLVDAENGVITLRTPIPLDRVGVAVVDPSTGDVLDERVGELVAADDERRFVTQYRDAVFTRLRDDAGGIDDRVLATISPGGSPFALVGPSVLVAEEATPSLVRWTLDPDDGPIPQSRPMLLTGSVRLGAPDDVNRLLAVGDSAIVIEGGGAVQGANVGENVAEIRWRVAGRLIGDAPSDRGRTLLVRRDGGRSQRVVDSSTGRTIVDVSSFGNELSVNDLYANGVVRKGGVGADARRIAVDLEGRTLWELPGTGPVGVGDRVVVDVSYDDERSMLDLAAYGPIATSPATCGSADESVQGAP